MAIATTKRFPHAQLVTMERAQVDAINAHRAAQLRPGGTIPSFMATVRSLIWAGLGIVPNYHCGPGEQP
jgi:hypothetical protein